MQWCLQFNYNEKKSHFLHFEFFNIFFSCKKEAEIIRFQYPSAYSKSEIKIQGDIRVFSISGEIINISIVNRFVQDDSLAYSNDINYKLIDRSFLDSILFIDATRANVLEQYIKLNCQITQTSRKIVLSRTDTSIGYTIGNELRRNIKYYLGQIKPEVFSEFINSSTGGFYLFGYRAKEKFIFTEVDGQIAAPLIQYSLYKTNGLEHRSSTNNLLQPDFYKSLGSGDTVSIREAVILFQKN